MSPMKKKKVVKRKTKNRAVSKHLVPHEKEDSDSEYGFSNTFSEFGMTYSELKNLVETQKKKKNNVDDELINEYIQKFAEGVSRSAEKPSTPESMRAAAAFVDLIKKLYILQHNASIAKIKSSLRPFFHQDQEESESEPDDSRLNCTSMETEVQDSAACSASSLTEALAVSNTPPESFAEHNAHAADLELPETDSTEELSASALANVDETSSTTAEVHVDLSTETGNISDEAHPDKICSNGTDMETEKIAETVPRRQLRSRRHFQLVAPVLVSCNDIAEFYHVGGPPCLLPSVRLARADPDQAEILNVDDPDQAGILNVHESVELNDGGQIGPEISDGETANPDEAAIEINSQHLTEDDRKKFDAMVMELHKATYFVDTIEPVPVHKLSSVTAEMRQMVGIPLHGSLKRSPDPPLIPPTFPPYVHESETFKTLISTSSDLNPMCSALTVWQQTREKSFAESNRITRQALKQLQAKMCSAWKIFIYRVTHAPGFQIEGNKFIRRMKRILKEVDPNIDDESIPVDCDIDTDADNLEDSGPAAEECIPDYDMARLKGSILKRLDGNNWTNVLNLLKEETKSLDLVAVIDMLAGGMLIPQLEESQCFVPFSSGSLDEQAIPNHPGGYKILVSTGLNLDSETLYVKKGESFVSSSITSREIVISIDQLQITGTPKPVTSGNDLEESRDELMLLEKPFECTPQARKPNGKMPDGPKKSLHGKRRFASGDSAPSVGFV